MSFSASTAFVVHLRETLRRGYPLLVIAVFSLVLLLVVPSVAFPLTYAWAVWTIYVALFAAYAVQQFVFPPPDWLLIGLTVPVFASFLTFGLLPALGVLFIGLLLGIGLHVLAAVVRPPADARAWLRDILLSGLYMFGLLTPTLLIGAAVYGVMGGPLPLTDVPMAAIPPLAGLFIAAFTAYNLLVLTVCSVLLKRPWPETGYYLFAVLMGQAVASLPAIVISVSFYEVGPLIFAFLLWGVIMLALLFRMIGFSHTVLSRYLGEMATLNMVSDLLSAHPTPTELFRTIFGQVSDLLDAPVFYAALYDSQQDTLSFPLVMVNGRQIGLPARHPASGPTEYILRRHRPLLLADLASDAQRLRLTTADAPEIQSSGHAYLGVPLLSGSDVLGVIAVEHPTRPDVYTAADRKLLEIIAAQAAIALHNTRLFDESRRMADSLMQINRVSSVINASLDLQTILQRICGVTLQLTGAHKTALFLKSETHLQFRPAYSIGLGKKALSALQNFLFEPDHPWMKTLVTARAIVVSDIEVDPDVAWIRDVAHEEGIRAVVSVPFISMRSVISESTLSPNRDLIGFLSVYYEESCTPAESELSLLTMLANQAAVAIENAFLFQETQDAVRRLAYMAEATRIFTGSLELGRVTQSVVDWIVSAMPVDSATLVLVSRDSQMLEMQAYAVSREVPMSLPQPDLAHRILEMPEVSHVMQGKWARAVEVFDPDVSPRLREILDRSHLHALIFVPLHVREQPIGVLALGLLEPRVLSAGDVKLVETVAAQAAAAIQNAQLHGLTEAALYDRLRELSALETVLARIAASIDEVTIVREVLDVAYTVTGADMLSCGLLDRPDSVTMYWWMRGQQPQVMHQRRFAMPLRGITGRVLRTGKAVRIPDTSREPDYWPPEYTDGFTSELCVPIFYEGRPLGVLNLESAVPGAFSEQQQRFLQNLARHMAIALERTRLFASRQRQIELLDAMRHLSLELLGAPTTFAVLDRVCKSVLEIVHGVNVHIYFYDEETDELTFAASLWADGRRNVEAAVPRPDGLTRKGLQSGGPVVSDAFSPVPGTPTRFIGVFPLKYADRVVGVLNVAVADAEHLGEDEVRALDLLANQTAIVLQRTRLSESRQHQIEMLEELRALSVGLLESLTLEKVQALVCRSALLIANAYDVHLYAYDEQTDTLAFVTSLRADGRRGVEAMRSHPDGVTYRTARSGEPVLIARDGLQFADDRADDPVHAILGIPLKHAEQVVGVLNVAVREGSMLGENERRVLDLLANQAAAAILRVRLYEEVREGRDRMRAILNTVRDALVLVDNHGYILEINPAAREILDQDLSTFVGKHFTQALRRLRRGSVPVPQFEGDGIRALFRQIRQSPRAVTRRDITTEIEGSRRYFEEISAPVLTESGQPLGRLFIWHDVTADRTLREARTELTNTIIHDLRSPLTAIKGGLSVLRELQDSPEDGETHREILDVVEGSTDNLLSLVESLLDVARMETGEMPLDLSTVSLEDVAQKTVQLLDMLANDARVTLEVDIPPDLPSIIMDADKIRRVLVNLVDNALRYTPTQGRVIIRAGMLPDGSMVRVQVIDSGPGVPPDVRERIFERFTTGVTGKPQRGRRGLGLGLTFCRLAVEAHGGRIWVEDAPEGTGAAFCFTLPVVPETGMMHRTTPAAEKPASGGESADLRNGEKHVH